MITLCDCALNGVRPADIDPAVVLLDVRESPAEVAVTTHAIAGRPGQRQGRTHVRALTVALDLEIHESDPTRRKAIAGSLARWAAPGGWLTVDDRPGQRLLVACDAPPALPSALHWTQPVTVTLTAREAPWWQEIAPVTVSAPSPAASGALSLRPTGDLPTPLEFTATNTGSGVLTAFSLTCAHGALRLDGLTWPPGAALTLAHDERGVLALRLDGASVLALRTPESADEVLLPPREESSVAWAAAGPVAVALAARGRCL